MTREEIDNLRKQHDEIFNELCEEHYNEYSYNPIARIRHKRKQEKAEKIARIVDTEAEKMNKAAYEKLSQELSDIKNGLVNGLQQKWEKIADRLQDITVCVKL